MSWFEDIRDRFVGDEDKEVNISLSDLENAKKLLSQDIEAPTEGVGQNTFDSLKKQASEKWRKFASNGINAKITSRRRRAAKTTAQGKNTVASSPVPPAQPIKIANPQAQAQAQAVAKKKDTLKKLGIGVAVSLLSALILKRFT